MPFFLQYNSMKEDISASLSARGELYGEARFLTLVTLKTVRKASKRVIQMIKC